MTQEMESEYMGSTKIMSIEEATKKKGATGDAAESFKEEIQTKQDTLFSDIMSVVFGWKVQEDGSKKLVSKLPNGKIIFPDRSEQKERVEPGVPYICLVFEREREAFAKICGEEYQPKIYVPTSRLVSMAWRDSSGSMKRKIPKEETYEERIVSAIKEMEELGFPSVRIIYRKNQNE